MKRTETRQAKIGRITIGGQNKVLIQSMCKHKTSHVEEVVKEINECAKLGADMMRVSILDEEDAQAIKEIKKQIKIPLIADIHFNGDFAIAAIKNGVDKIRLNPGNINDEAKIKEIVELAKKKHVVIRVGANSGSVSQEFADADIPLAHKLLLSAKKQVQILEKYDFHDIVISLKASNIRETINAYELASELFPYPLHIGITEAGPYDLSVIRSTAGLAPLLLEGVGDTIRISITGDAQSEVVAVGFPIGGRLISFTRGIVSRIEEIRYAHGWTKLTVACMGCIVNGPGEGKSADIGIAGGKGQYVIFKKGQVIKKVSEAEAYDALIKEIDSLR